MPNPLYAHCIIPQTRENKDVQNIVISNDEYEKDEWIKEQRILLYFVD